MSTTVSPKKALPARKPAKKSSHPPTGEMVESAIRVLKERKGSSLPAIKKYIAATYLVDVDKLAVHIKKYIKSAVAAKSLVQTKGVGANGSFRLAALPKAPAKKPTTQAKKPVAAKKPVPVKKPAVKKTPVSKKTTARKETPKKKPTAKKAAPLMKKGAKLSAKSPAAKKPAAKKPTAKKAAAAVKPKETKAKTPKTLQAKKSSTAKPAAKPKKATTNKAAAKPKAAKTKTAKK